MFAPPVKFFSYTQKFISRTFSWEIFNILFRHPCMGFNFFQGAWEFSDRSLVKSLMGFMCKKKKILKSLCHSVDSSIQVKNSIFFIRLQFTTIKINSDPSVESENLQMFLKKFGGHVPIQSGNDELHKIIVKKS